MKCVECREPWPSTSLKTHGCTASWRGNTTWPSSGWEARWRWRCRAQVQVCSIESRVFPPWGRGSAWMDDEKYRLIAKAVNRKLPRVLKGTRFLNFTARPFGNALGLDGVHFRRKGRWHVAEKIRNAIKHEVERWKAIQAMGDYWQS